jgi:FkbM family methyltransferase
MSVQQLKDFIKWSAARVGVDIRSSKHTESAILGSILRRLRPISVLDVGANVGQYAQRLRAAGFRGTVVSFEALEGAHGRLVEAARADPTWIVAPRAAVGAHAGTLDFNVSADVVSSSVLPVTKLLQEAAPRVTYVGHERTPCVRLDSLTGLLPEGNLFLKVDTQGYELEVLRGASALLPRIVAMQLELSLIPLYEGAPAMTEVLQHVQSRGFELFQLVPALRDERSGRLMQAEGFFVRGSTQSSGQQSVV